MSGTPTNLQSPYRIFISFASADRELAEHLAAGLRRNLNDFDAVYCFSKPGRYNSKGGSRPSDNFIQLIDERLKKCNVFLLLWSVHARGSNGVMYELNQAKHFYIKNTKRLGKEFKILPVRINKCGLPLGLTSIVYVNHSTGDNLQNVLNQVLDFLGYPPENDHPSVIVVKQAIFELQIAFQNKDWQTVIRQYLSIFGHYPRAISATTHYMYAIALIKQEQVAESLRIMREGLVLPHRERDDELLYLYAQCLKERWRWNDVHFLAEKALLLFPNDARWQQLLLEAYGNSNNTLSSFPYAQNQPTSQLNRSSAAFPYNQSQLPPQSDRITSAFQQPQSNSSSNFGQVSNADIIGTTHHTGSSLNYSYPHLQQPPFSSHMGFHPNPNNSYISNGFNPPVPDPITEQIQLPQDNIPQVTEELSQEEALSKMTAGFWHIVQSFIEKHLSYQKIRRILTFATGFTALLNSLCFLLISLVWPYTVYFMGGGVVVMFLILCLGRTRETATAKVLCILSLCALWWASGLCLGYMVNNWWKLETSTSFSTWVEIVCTLAVIILYSFIHLKLFFSEE